MRPTTIDEYPSDGSRPIASFVRPGWRLWIRCVETDREVRLETSIVECYNTVFRTNNP